MFESLEISSVEYCQGGAIIIHFFCGCEKFIARAERIVCCDEHGPIIRAWYL